MLLASRHEDAHLHRTLVRVGAACAWVITAIYFVVGLASGDRSVWTQGVSPLLASMFLTAQIALDREDAGVALFACGAIGTFWYTLFGTESTLVPMAITAVIISALGMFFVKSHRLVIAAGLAVGLFGVSLLWPVDTEQKLTLAPIVAASFLLTHIVLSTLQSAAAEVDSRYQLLFDTSPIAVLEEDWSEAIEYVRSEYAGKPNRLRQFLLAYPMVVSKAVGKAKVVRFNEAAVNLLDMGDPESYVGHRDPRIVNEHTLEAFVDALVCLYEDVPTWEAEISMRTRSGDIRWLEARSMQAQVAQAGTSIVVAIADITHMRERHEAMSDLVKAKDEFIATISHELRTPLTAVIGLTSEMATGEMTPEESNELMQLVSEQASEMYNIVDDLLVAARADMGTVTIDTRKVDLLTEMRAAMDGVGFEVECPDDAVPEVLADSRRVRQILRNLLTNARRYGGPNTRIVVGSLTDSAWIEVRDDGPGITDTDAEHIFEPYVTGRSPAEGSVGLGLAVARQLAELMGGSLSYHHDEAESIFRLQLPLAQDRGSVLASHSP